MTCQTPIDPATGVALKGDALVAALHDPASRRCGYGLCEDDVFCPACGARVNWNPGTLHESSCGVSDADCRYGCGVLKEIGNGVVMAVGGIGKMFSGLINAVMVIIAGIWIYGAVCAHNDIEKHRSFGVILQRMYGTEYNSLTRHGYKMYIKHFTTTDPDEKLSVKNLCDRLEGVFNESGSDLCELFDDKHNTSESRAVYRLRENLADAAGDAAKGNGTVSDGVEAALAMFLIDALSEAEKKSD